MNKNDQSNEIEIKRLRKQVYDYELQIQSLLNKINSNSQNYQNKFLQIEIQEENLIKLKKIEKMSEDYKYSRHMENSNEKNINPCKSCQHNMYQIINLRMNYDALLKENQIQKYQLDKIKDEIKKYQIQEKETEKKKNFQELQKQSINYDNVIDQLPKLQTKYLSDDDF